MKLGFARKHLNYLSALAQVGVFTAISNVSMAQNLSTSVTTIHTGMSAMPNIITGGCYIIGAALVGAGLLKLKAYSEAPNQVKIGEGLGRVVIGACLLAAPAMSGWIATSVGSTGTALTSGTLGTIN